MAIEKEEIQSLLSKYKKKISENLATPEEQTVDAQPVTTREYVKFRSQYMPKHLSWYESACQQADKLLKIKPDKKKMAEYEKAIETTHLQITPGGAVSFALLMPSIIIIVGGLISFMIFQSLFFVMLFFVLGAAVIGPLNKLPLTLADRWRMKGSNQMILSVFYAVTYMRHTSNMELAIDFAADHISPPLSLDLKKVLWNVETEKYPNVKESMDAYLETWKGYNNEFIESFHLLESSLLETSEERRLGLLDKSLSVILDETYEKMLHYAQDLKAPITMLHMMGVILPILGLVILPLVVSFMEGVEWYHIAAGYNFFLPLGVYYLGTTILAKRPSGYGAGDISENNPELDKLRKLSINLGNLQIKIKPLYVSIIVGMVLLIIATFPIWVTFISPNIKTDVADPGHIDITLFDGKFDFYGYRASKTDISRILGPFGLGSTVLSLALPLALGLSIGLFFKLKSKNVIKLRENAKALEAEFASALFQLGNRLGDGLPAEIAFSRVSQTIQGTKAGDFFGEVTNNITRMGLSVEQAIFDPQVGALRKYPSSMIESTMKVLVESAKKGPSIAATALLNVSRYIKEIHRVDERLKDLMAEIVGSMKAQISFLTPAIAGIVIGLTSMVTTILGKLGSQLTEVAGGGGEGAAAGGLLSMFGDGIPTFYFQIVVGVYVVQIVYILTIMINGIQNGVDKLNEQYLLGVNMIKSTVLYVLISFVIIIMFNFIAGNILATQGGPSLTG